MKKKSWVNLGKQIRNLRNENAEEESSNQQVQQRKKIYDPFLIGYQARDEENLVGACLEEGYKVQSNQIIYADCWNFKT